VLLHEVVFEGQVSDHPDREVEHQHHYTTQQDEIALASSSPAALVVLVVPITADYTLAHTDPTRHLHDGWRRISGL
jgi:hypothetical protein